MTVDADTSVLVNADEPKGKATRTRKGKAADRPKGKRSLNLSLMAEDYERLAVHALRHDMTISDLVSKLARDHCREFHITRTATRSEGGGE